MPFDPAKPAQGAPLSSAEMRTQLNALNDKIDALAAVVAALPTNALMADAISAASSTTLGNALAASSNNTNGVAVLGSSPGDPPSGSDVQTAYDKLNELINAARRV